MGVRGVIVRLNDSWQNLVQDRAQSPSGQYPPAIEQLLGEMAAASLLMQANIKFNGALILQMHGDGPVKLAVTEVQPNLSFRSTAQQTPVPSGSVAHTEIGTNQDFAPIQSLLNIHGQGRLAITLDPLDRLPGQQPYQGIVPLKNAQGQALESLAQVIEHYMLQSEQLETRLVLAANENCAAGILLQRLPPSSQTENINPSLSAGASDDFNRLGHLLATLTRAELLELDCPTLLRRLFWEEQVRLLLPTLYPSYRCRCSRERVGRMLFNLGLTEANTIIAEQSEIDIGCEYCGKHYFFDSVDIGQLFTPDADQPPTSQSIQ